MDAIRAKTPDIPGMLVEVTAPRAGPPTGKPIQVQISPLDPKDLPAAAEKVSAIVRRHPDIRDFDDGKHVPVGNFVQRVASPRVGYINRVNSSRVTTVSANVAEGVQSAKVQQEITN